MAQRIEIPGIGPVDFPDNMSDDQISAAIRNNMPAAGKLPEVPAGPGVVEDVAKSAVSGLGSGAIGVLGMPGDIGSMVSAGADKAAGLLGIQTKTPQTLSGLVTGEQPAPNSWQNFKKVAGQAMSAFPMTRPFMGAGSREIQNQVEQATGEFYKPKTGFGKAAHTVGEFAPGALMPGGVVQRVLNVAGPSAGAELADAVSGNNPYWRMAGAALGGLAGARGITPAAATPERLHLVQALEREGVPLTAGERTGSRAMQWRESAAGDQPFSSGRAAQLKDEQGRAFTGAVLRRMGAGGDELATAPVIDREVTRIGDAFNTLSARNTLNADRAMANDMLATARQYVDTVIPSQRVTGSKNIQGIIQDVTDVIQRNGGQMPGDLYQATRSRLGAMGDGVRQSDPQLSTAIKGIQKALDDAMGRSISPGDRTAWAEARSQWKNWKAIEKAVTGAGSQVAEGYISPSQLRAAVATQNRGQYARGKGDLAELARAGEAILKPLPQSGTAPRLNASNFSTANLLAGVYNRAYISKPVQAYLGNQSLARNPMGAKNSALIDALMARPREQ